MDSWIYREEDPEKKIAGNGERIKNLKKSLKKQT